MAVKAVLFDFGGVLALHATKILAKKFYKKFGIGKNKLIDFWRTIEDDFDIGNLTEKKVWSIFKKHFNIKADTKKLEKIHKDSFILRKAIYSLAKKLSKKYAVGIFSNMPKEISRFLRKKFNLSFFHYIFFSAEVRKIKPNKNYYLFTAKKMKLKPSEIVFIDDKMVNVKGARKVGLKSFQFKSLEDTKKQLKRLGIR